MLRGTLAIVLLVYCSVSPGRTGSNDSPNFLRFSEDARESLAETRSEIQAAISHYNILVLVTAKKPQSTVKRRTEAKICGSCLWNVSTWESDGYRVTLM